MSFFKISPTSAMTLALATAACLLWCWSPELTHFGGDSAGYMLAAQYFSYWQAPGHAVLDYSQNIIYPPLFPWLLGLFNAGYDPLRAHLLIGLMLACNVYLLFILCRKLAFTERDSLLTSLLFLLMPSTRLIALSIWSENLYLLFSLVTIVCLAGFQRDQKSSLLVVASLAIIAATLTRVAALPLLLAFFIYLALIRPRGWLIYSLLSGLPFGLWSLTSRSRHQSGGISGYTTVWADRYELSGFQEFAGLLMEQFRDIANAWHYDWTHGTPGIMTITAVTVIAAFSVASWLHRLREKEFDAFYVLIYLLVLLAWHSSGEVPRYLYVLYPFMLVYALLTARYLLQRFTPSPSVALLMAQALLLLLVLSPLLKDLGRYALPLPAPADRYRQNDVWYWQEDPERALEHTANLAALSEHIKSLAGRVDETECIFSVKPNMLTLLSNRISRPPPALDTNEIEFQHALEECRYIYAMQMPTPGFPTPMYPVWRLDNKARLVDVVLSPLDNRQQPIGMLLEISQ